MEGTKNIDATVIFADGRRRRVLITSGAIDFLQRTARLLPFLFEGTGFNPLDADASNIVAVTRADHDVLHWYGREQHEAAFRLGQMDMQQAAADLLLDLADGTQGDVCATLIDAAERIRSLAVCEKVKEAADGDT